MTDRNRLKRTQEIMDRTETDVMILTPGSDLMYLSGYGGMADERFTALILCRGEEPFFIAHRLYGNDAERTGIREVNVYGEGADPYLLLKSILEKKRSGVRRIAVPASMQARFLLEILKTFPEAEITDGSSLLAPLRQIKDRQELDVMIRVSALTEECEEAVISRGTAWIGHTELEFQAAMVTEFRKRGLGGTGGLVSVGENAAEPHHRAGRTMIREGACLLHDVGGILKGYHADMTRTYYFGKPDSRFLEIYEVVLEANRAAEKTACTGVPLQEIDRAARRVIEKAGYGQYFTHRTGHGIGIDGHEGAGPAEGVTDIVRPGMVFSVEPGIYLPGEFGVRIEDLMAAEEDGRVICLNRMRKELICFE